MKPQQIPDYYKPTFCQEGVEVIGCDYLLSKDCNRKCDFAKQYHPFERAKFLEQRAMDESEFFGGSAINSTNGK